MYRPEWFPKDSILEMTINVVGYVRGNYDTMPENHALNVKALRHAVDNWTWYNKSAKDKTFDFHVFAMIRVALEMEEDFQKERQQFRESLKELTRESSPPVDDIGITKVTKY